MKTSSCRKLAAGVVALTLVFSVASTSVFAESLDDIVNGSSSAQTQQQVQEQPTVVPEQTTPTPAPETTQQVPNTESNQ